MTARDYQRALQALAVIKADLVDAYTMAELPPKELASPLRELAVIQDTLTLAYTGEMR